MLFKALLLFFIGGLNVLVGCLVLARDHRKTQNRLFFLFSTSLGGWVIGIGGFLLSNDPRIAFAWAKAYYSFPLIVGLSMPLFAKSFPLNEDVPRSWWVSLLSGYLLVALPLLLIPTFVTERLVYHDWGKEILLNKPEYLIYSVFLLSCLILGQIHTLLKSRRLRGIARLQAQFFFAGFLLTSVFGVLFNMFLPWFGNYRLIWLGPLFTSAFVSTVGYGIIRHRMFDIRAVVARSITYLGALVVLATVYGFVVFGFIEFVLKIQVPVELQMLIAAATGVASLGFQRVKEFFDQSTSRLFYRDAYNPQAFLDELNRALVSNIELEKLLKVCSQIIADNLKAEYCLFGIKEIGIKGIRTIGTIKKDLDAKDILTLRRLSPQSAATVVVADHLLQEANTLRQLMLKKDIAVLVRLVPEFAKEKDGVEGLGYIVLGQKRSGNMYTSQDVQMLGIIANELAIAIQNALHFEEIQRFNITLQEKVDNATRKLRRTNQKLEELDETKDDFISMASHQLRTPLTSVKGYLSMVLEGDAGKLSNTQSKMLGQAFVSSQRMVYLITDLLNVSRLKTGKFIIDSSPTDLSRVVGEEVSQLVETAQARQIELSYDKPASFPVLMLDETKTRQVIMNFIDNAIYYTRPGGRIQIELADKPATIELRVIDDGIGVPKSEQHHLFTKFYRAANARKARPDGTGLGLFMAKKVIVAQGGSIIFSSKEGHGSTFGFVFSKSHLKRPVGVARLTNASKPPVPKG